MWGGLRWMPSTRTCGSQSPPMPDLRKAIALLLSLAREAAFGANCIIGGTPAGAHHGNGRWRRTGNALGDRPDPLGRDLLDTLHELGRRQQPVEEQELARHLLGPGR